VTSTYVVEFLPIKNRGRYMEALPAGFSVGLLLVAGETVSFRIILYYYYFITLYNNNNRKVLFIPA